MAYIKCSHKCPGGADCRCNGAIPHTLHLCSDKTCECHRATRYGLELVHDRHGREAYIRVGTVLVARVEA